jgi:hypothetical protein
MARVKARAHAAAGVMNGILRRPCVRCGIIWERKYGSSREQKYCSKECRAATANDNRLARKRKDFPPCKHIGCNRKASRVESGLCEACYYQKRRTGSLDRVLRIGRTVNKQGYVSICDPTHPLFSKTQRYVIEHRKVIYDSMNGADPNCYWCGVQLKWRYIDVNGKKKTSVVIDHLNENKSDNRVSNLVASCNNCNRARGAILPFIERLDSGSLEEFMFRIRERHTARHGSIRFSVTTT